MKRFERDYNKYLEKMKPFGITRKGSMHDGKGSASDIRAKISANESAQSLMPQSALDIFEKSNRANREIYCVITDALGNKITTDTVTLICK